MTGFLEVQHPRRRRKRDPNATQEPPRCEACGTSWVGMRVLYIVNRDGSTRDYRPASERWQSLQDFIAECRKHIGGDA